MREVTPSSPSKPVSVYIKKCVKKSGNQPASSAKPQLTRLSLFMDLTHLQTQCQKGFSTVFSFPCGGICLPSPPGCWKEDRQAAGSCPSHPSCPKPTSTVHAASERHSLTYTAWCDVSFAPSTSDVSSKLVGLMHLDLGQGEGGTAKL